MLLPVQHSAVDSTGRVHTPQLSQWAYGASRLGDVVADAVATLSGSAAEVAPRLTAGSYTSQGSSGGSFSAGGSYSGPAPTYSQLGPMSQARLNLMGEQQGALHNSCRWPHTQDWVRCSAVMRCSDGMVPGG